MRFPKGLYFHGGVQFTGYFGLVEGLSLVQAVFLAFFLNQPALYNLDGSLFLPSFIYIPLSNKRDLIYQKKIHTALDFSAYTPN